MTRLQIVGVGAQEEAYVSLKPLQIAIASPCTRSLFDKWHVLAKLLEMAVLAQIVDVVGHLPMAVASA